MPFKILPQDLQITIDQSQIRTKIPYTEVTTENIAALAKESNLGAGDTILVKVMNDDMTELLHEAEFVVISRKESRVIRQTGFNGTHESDVVSYEVAQKGEWWHSPLVQREGGPDTHASVYEPSPLDALNGLVGEDVQVAAEATPKVSEGAVKKRRGRPPKQAAQ